MNAKHLESLIIDQALDELPEDVSALLDAYLATHPDARAEAEDIRDAMGLAHRTLQDHPELVRNRETDDLPAKSQVAQFITQITQTRLAQAALLVLTAGILGFVIGHRDTPDSQATLAKVETAESNESPSAPIPWARYRIAENSLGSGLSAVVSNLESSEPSSNP